jgi:hypothetical protein
MLDSRSTITAEAAENAEHQNDKMLLRLAVTSCARSPGGESAKSENLKPEV